MPDTIKLFASDPIKYNGKRYHQTMFEVENKEHADALRSSGAAKDITDAPASNSEPDANVVKLEQPPESAEERIAAIKSATERLVTENVPENFTSTNGPTVDALAAVLNWKPTAPERNQVWADRVASQSGAE